jgi:indole-3-glycerol phosphate synthase
MKIKVTRQDIQSGEAGNSSECAISLALQNEPILKIDNINLKVLKKDINKVCQFIELFDDYVFAEDVVIDESCIPRPFEFEVNQ